MNQPMPYGPPRPADVWEEDEYGNWIPATTDEKSPGIWDLLGHNFNPNGSPKLWPMTGALPGKQWPYNQEYPGTKDPRVRDSLLQELEPNPWQRMAGRQAAILRAESNGQRRARDASLWEERIRRVARERVAQEAAETAKAVINARNADQQDRSRADEQERLIALEQEEFYRRQKERDDAIRNQILREEEARRLREHKEREDFRNSILAEERKRVREEIEMAAKLKQQDERLEEICRANMNLSDMNSPYAQHPGAIFAPNPYLPPASGFMRVKAKYISPETLQTYNMSWNFDPEDDTYVIINEAVPKKLQQILFDHTERMEKKSKSSPSTSTVSGTKKLSSSGSSVPPPSSSSGTRSSSDVDSSVAPPSSSSGPKTSSNAGSRIPPPSSSSGKKSSSNSASSAAPSSSASGSKKSSKSGSSKSGSLVMSKSKSDGGMSVVRKKN